MRKVIQKVAFSSVAMSGGVVLLLALVYIALIAVVMSYAAVTIEFTQSVRNDSSIVADLESQYLSMVSETTAIDFLAEGYVKPKAQIYVETKSATALR